MLYTGLPQSIPNVDQCRILALIPMSINSDCRTANFRVQEIFVNFANSTKFEKISYMLILPEYSRELALSPGFYGMSKIAKISCRENFLFYSICLTPHPKISLNFQELENFPESLNCRVIFF